MEFTGRSITTWAIGVFLLTAFFLVDPAPALPQEEPTQESEQAAAALLEEVYALYNLPGHDGLTSIQALLSIRKSSDASLNKIKDSLKVVYTWEAPDQEKLQASRRASTAGASSSSRPPAGSWRRKWGWKKRGVWSCPPTPSRTAASAWRAGAGRR